MCSKMESTAWINSIAEIGIAAIATKAKNLAR
jgi:hypothetical protein